jgi:hypothetical protein
MKVIRKGIGEKGSNVGISKPVGMKFRKNDLDGAKGLSEEFVLRMFKAIHQESIVHQESD